MNKLIAAFAVAVVASSCGVNPDTAADASSASQTEIEPIEIMNASVQHGDHSAHYLVSWQTRPVSGAVRVEVSTDPNFAPGDGEVIGEFSQASSAEWTASAPERHYFAIIPEAGDVVRSAVRLLPLEGGRNFRDMGGYKTENGQTVKWGHIFRSGVMHELTEGDYRYLSGLGIRTICDYRSAAERALEPTNWQAGNIDYVVFADPEEDTNPLDNPMIAALMDPESTPEQVEAGMAAGYVQIAYEQAPAYTQMFDRLAAGEIPLAFNCSAGKDRAGTSAALLLTALGVPRYVVVHDYSLSDDYVDYMAEFLGDGAPENLEDHPYGFLFQMPPEKLAPLMASPPVYIESTFNALEAEHGSVMNFIQTELGVSDEELASIRAALLED